MPPKKEKKDKKGEKGKKVAAAAVPRKRKGYVDFQREGFTGHVWEGGRYAICTSKPRDAQPGGRQVCGAKIINDERNLGSHWHKHHVRGSAGDRDAKKDGTRPWVCPCGLSHDKWDNHLRHIRGQHGFRGKSKAIREAGGLLNSGRCLDSDGQLVEEEEDDDDDDEGFVPPPMDGPQDPKFNDDDHHHGGHGPSGAAGGLIAA